MPDSCICGGWLHPANPHGIRACHACGGTTDRDGLYVPDPRAPQRPPVIVYSLPPAAIHIATSDLDIEKLCRAYLKAAAHQQRLVLPPEEWAEVPQYDDLDVVMQNLVISTMTAAIEEWLGLDQHS